MADDNSLVIVLENCLPTGPIELMSARQNDVQTTPWTFTVNGNVTIPSYLVNGNIAPNGFVDPRNVAVGADGQLLLDDGTILSHVLEATIRIDPQTATVQPLGTTRILRRITSAEITLTFSEYKINDYFILARVVPPLLQISNGGQCDSYLNFIGRVNNRICV